eukprot:CAMPEP_0185280466 /NCGR_PEP_ID=MMETSP1359-20130426/66141_1 /TAXON_ID=552665 /ORGANISM="Bigelowiella longifila, Strain CCMP242" /LENGTH=230 /DNA_ID=CAMNT_0027875721 /DNA_START=143 /DNA_END=835 /DNA_ORIENTATION=+
MLFVCLVLLLVVTAMFMILKSGGVVSSKRDSILIVGPMGSGKTALFYRLVLGEKRDSPMTVTSQAPNEDTFCPGEGGGKLGLVDLPGHDSQWPAALERVQDAVGVIFLIDSSKPQINVAGQKLFDLLCDPSVKNNKIPFMIACNKTDLPEADGVEKIEEELINDLRDRSEMKDTIEDTEGNVIQKTLVDGTGTADMFEFEQSPCPVEIVKVSLQKKDIGPVLKFCENLVR